MKTVLIHYHIFKNSGSTLDYALKKSFGSSMLSFEAPNGAPLMLQAELADIIHNHPSKIAFTSHTIRLPAPRMDSVTALPIVIVRHPLLRLHSIFSFLGRATLKERLRSLAGRETVSQSCTPTRLARSCNSFPEWVESMLGTEEGRSYVSNAQTRFLSGGYNTRPRRDMSYNGDGLGFDLDAAIENLSEVKLLARTENFDTDIERFAPVLAEHEITMNLKNLKPRNVSSSDFKQPTALRVRRLEEQLGVQLSGELNGFLEQDMTLYNWVNQRLDVSS